MISLHMNAHIDLMEYLKSKTSLGVGAQLSRGKYIEAHESR